MADEISQEKQREVALKNVGAGGLRDLAVAHYVTKDNNFGENDNSVVESFLYAPSMSSDVQVYRPDGTSTGLVLSSLFGSRDEGERYSGSVSERGVIKTAGDIVTQSLFSLTVKDVLDSIGYEGSLEGVSDGSYLSDLNKGSDEDKKVAQTLINLYRSQITDRGLSSAYGQSADAVSGNLEKILSLGK